MEPINILIVSDTALGYDLNEDGTASIAYNLAKDYFLERPCLTKVLKVEGAGKPLVLEADWVSPQDVMGKLRPVLGYSSEGANAWTSLATNYIPSRGWITLTALDSTPIKNRNPIQIWITIAQNEQIAHSLN